MSPVPAIPGKRVAILGSTSHVAKATMPHLRQRVEITHVARDKRRVEEHLRTTAGDGCDELGRLRTFDEFSSDRTHFDAIVNCVGFGTPEKLAGAGLEIYRLTDRIDEVCLARLERDPATVYVNFSSGAVYGTAHDDLIGEDPVFQMHLNKPDGSDHYRLAKLHCERKHRAWPQASIIDLRLFSFFSEFIDLESKYLLCDIVRCVRDRTTMMTGANDIVRDFVHPSDLADLVCRAACSKGINAAVDVYSRKPLRKFELLEKMSSRYGLVFKVEDRDVGSSPTGSKAYYASGSRAAAKLFAYDPAWSSTEAVIDGIDRCLAGRKSSEKRDI